jgi:hypothetical protein
MYKDILQFNFSVWNNKILGKLFQTLKYINRKLLTRLLSKEQNHAPEEYVGENDQVDRLLNKVVFT